MPNIIASNRNKNFINNVVFPADLVNMPMIAGYSTRKLRRNYNGYACELRRWIDNTTQNFGFNSFGDFDKSSADLWSNGTCFVSKLYDKSSNGMDIFQTGTNNQPLYISSASNNKPGILFDGIDDYLIRDGFIESNPITVFIVIKSNNSFARYIADLGSGWHSIIQGYVSGKVEWYYSPRTVLGDISLVAFQVFYFNNASNSLNAKVGLGGYVGGASDFFSGTILEAIYFNGVLSNNQIDNITKNIKNYYNI